MKRVFIILVLVTGAIDSGRTAPGEPNVSLSDFFKAGVVFQDRNGDGVVDFVNAQLVQNRSRMPSIIRLCFLSWGPGSSPRRSTQLAWISDEPG